MEGARREGCTRSGSAAPKRDLTTEKTSLLTWTRCHRNEVNRGHPAPGGGGFPPTTASPAAVGAPRPAGRTAATSAHRDDIHQRGEETMKVIQNNDDQARAPIPSLACRPPLPFPPPSPPRDVPHPTPPTSSSAHPLRSLPVQRLSVLGDVSPLNRVSHSSHRNGLTLWRTVCMCLDRVAAWLNAAPHTGHDKDRSISCTALWCCWLSYRRLSTVVHMEHA